MRLAPARSGLLRAARATGQCPGAHGSLISASRANGHLLFISMSSRSTLRRLASTSARRATRSVVASRVLLAMPCASSSTASAFFRLLRASASRPLSCCTVALASLITPCGPKTWASALPARPSTRWVRPSSRDSKALVRSSVVRIFWALCSLPINRPRAPRGPFRRPVAVSTWARLLASGASAAVSAVRLASRSRTPDISLGISAAASPASTGRTAPSGSGGSASTPL